MAGTAGDRGDRSATGQRNAAEPIRGDVPGSFAWSVLRHRHPALIAQVGDAFPYPPRHQRALAALLEEIVSGVITPLEPGAHDHDEWGGWSRDRLGMRWFDVEFLWAESYFYRRLLQAVGYFTPGAWWGIDPFAPAKHAELHGDALSADLARFGEILALPDVEQREALLLASLWGNRADLGFRLSTRLAGSGHRGDQGEPGDPDGEAAAALLADDSALLWSVLEHQRPGTVCVVADNAGPELIGDLALIDHLLRTGLATRVSVHVKPYPYYVSDAVTADVVAALRLLRGAGGAAGRLGDRLWGASRSGRLELRSHGFHCAPVSFRHLPEDLAEEFAAASVTLVKGDLNYRRLVGDRAWAPTTPFAELTGYFPGPLVAMRTLKCDVAVGLSQPRVAALDASDPGWRTSGAYAVIHARP